MTTYNDLHEATLKAHQNAISNGTLENYWEVLGSAAYQIDRRRLTKAQAIDAIQHAVKVPRIAA